MKTSEAIEELGRLRTEFNRWNRTKTVQVLDKAIEVMENRDVIEKLEVRLRSLERGEYHPHEYIRIDEVKDLIEAFKLEVSNEL